MSSRNSHPEPGTNSQKRPRNEESSHGPQQQSPHEQEQSPGPEEPGPREQEPSLDSEPTPKRASQGLFTGTFEQLSVLPPAVLATQILELQSELRNEVILTAATMRHVNIMEEERRRGARDTEEALCDAFDAAEKNWHAQCKDIRRKCKKDYEYLKNACKEKYEQKQRTIGYRITLANELYKQEYEDKEKNIIEENRRNLSRERKSYRRLEKRHRKLEQKHQALLRDNERLRQAIVID